MNASPTSSLSGLNAAIRRLDVAANNVANTSTPGYQRQTVVQDTQAPEGVIVRVQASAPSESGPTDDMTQDMVDQAAASAAFKANLQVLKSQLALAGALLDLYA
jgi:flagellar basal body rod protein FlgC